MSVVLARPPVVVRSVVATDLPAADYREDLRFDFYFACAYCSLSESEAIGSSFEIDHHRPVAAGGGDAYENLMWTCRFCNRIKGSVWPSGSALALGRRFVRPDVDHPLDHFELIGLRVSPLSEAGRFSEVVLDLNRAYLRRIRDLRSRMRRAQAEIVGGLQALAAARFDRVPAQERDAFLRARSAVLRQSRDVSALVSELTTARVENHSALLDPDPDRANRVRARKDYLSDIGVVAIRKGQVAR